MRAISKSRWSYPTSACSDPPVSVLGERHTCMDDRRCFALLVALEQPGYSVSDLSFVLR